MIAEESASNLKWDVLLGLLPVRAHEPASATATAEPSSRPGERSPAGAARTTEQKPTATAELQGGPRTPSAAKRRVMDPVEAFNLLNAQLIIEAGKDVKPKGPKVRPKVSALPKTPSGEPKPASTGGGGKPPKGGGGGAEPPSGGGGGPRGRRVAPDIDAEVERAFKTLPKGDEYSGATADPKSPVRSGVPVSVPVEKSGKPPRVLEVGAGPKQVKVGLPPDTNPKLVRVYRSDISKAGGPHLELDATKPLSENLRGRFTTMIINNPRGYTPRIDLLSAGLTTNGKIIVQGNLHANPDFRNLTKIDVPPGMVRTIEKKVRPLGEGFSRTVPEPGKPDPFPDARITFEWAEAVKEAQKKPTGNWRDTEGGT